jgi:hypothetical protein
LKIASEKGTCNIEEKLKNFKKEVIAGIIEKK